jgi:AsmA protein
MKTTIKWLLIVVGVLLALAIAAIIFVPMFVNIQTYKPQIEKKVSEATGLPCTIGGDLKLSLFPWVGVSFSGLHLGNPPGFEKKDLLSIKAFEARVKLLPLLTRNIEMKRFILDRPSIVLERNKAGLGNWEEIGKASAGVPARPSETKKAPAKSEPREGLPISGISVGEFSITQASLLWINDATGERREISDLNLRLRDVSLERPVRMTLSAKLDDQPISLEGNVGPLGKDPGKGTIPLSLVLKALEQLNVSIKGNIRDPISHPGFDLALQVFPFSPRKLAASLKQTFPVTTADPQALTRVALQAALKGDPQNISVSDGVIDLDESNLKFSVRAKDFSKPDVAFVLQLNQIDLDRYLPPPSEKETSEKKETAPAPSAKKKPDYTPLRKLVLDGSLRVAKLKAHGATIEDIYLKVTGKNGQFRVDPLSLRLYQGDMAASANLDVRTDTPLSQAALRAKGIQAGPLLKDLLKVDFLEGTVTADVDLRMSGDEPERIKETLNGKGDLRFNDGAIVGIDLAGMVRNAAAAFGLAEKGTERPRTDFAELDVPFTITNGLFDTPKTSLTSPLLRVNAAGTAHLVKETLDFRVEPKFVATLKGQGDVEKRSGIEVPVLVSGTFSAPKFRPDLKGMVTKGLEGVVSEPSKLKSLLPGKEKGEGKSDTLQQKTKDLLKGLQFGK